MLRYQALGNLTYATGREGIEDGNPCVTSVTIISFEIITFRQTSFSIKLIFLSRPENINVI